MDKSLKTALLFGVAFMILAIALWLHLKEQVRLLKSYCWKIKNFKIVKFSKDSAQVDLNIIFKNMSDLQFDITKYNFDVYVNERYVTTVSESVIQHIKAKGLSDFAIKAIFVPSKVFSATILSNILLNYLNDKNSIRFTFQGYISIKHSIIKAENIPIKLSYTLKELLTPDASLEVCTI